MHQARIIAVSAVALCLPTREDAFLLPSSHLPASGPPRDLNLYIAHSTRPSTQKPSLKPSWKSPRWSAGAAAEPASGEEVPGAQRTRSAESSNGGGAEGIEGLGSPAAAQQATSPAEEAASTIFTRTYSRPAWRPTPASNTPAAAKLPPVAPESPSGPGTAAVAAASTAVPQAAVGVSTRSLLVEEAAEPVAPPSILAATPKQGMGGGTLGKMVDIGISMGLTKEALAPFQKKIQDNIAEGNLGERGEEWAIAQAAIVLVIAAGNIPVVGDLVLLLAGPGLLVGGVIIIGLGVTALGQSLSPWPAPTKDNELKTDGMYGIVRHPLYTGLAMCCFGFGVATASPLRMILAVLLALLFDKKASKEEGMLVELHGEAYEEYLAAVAKFVPGFY